MPETAANKAITDLLNQQIAEGRQIGAQVTVYKDGEIVIDTVVGRMGPDDDRPVQPDSLFCCFSTTKGVAATALHILADRGEIDYDAPVVKYWPAFGQHGKDKLTVAQAFSHQAGLHAMPSPFLPEHITDWDAGIKRMEEGVPAYEPGTQTGYHAVTFAWVAGGIIAGATGRHIKDVIREEIAIPLGIEDEMYVGIPDGVEDRLATLEIATIGVGVPDDHDMFKAMPQAQWQHFNEMAFRKACLPSGNGHFTSRALAKMYAALAGDGSIDGVRLVSPERQKFMNKLQTDRVDRVLGVAARKGIGFGLGGEMNHMVGAQGPRLTAFGHAGAGGSIAFADPEKNMAVALTINKMQYPLPGTGPTLEITNLIRKELDAE